MLFETYPASRFLNGSGLLLLFLFACAWSCNKKETEPIAPVMQDALKADIKKLLLKSYSYQDKNMDSVLFFADSAQQLSAAIKDTNGIIAASYVKAHVLSNSGKFDRAIQQMNKAITLTRLSNNKEQWLPVLYTLGGIYAKMDIIDSATFYFLKAYKTIDSSTRMTDIAALTNSIGYMMGAQGNNRLAVKYLEESLHAVEQLRDTLKILYTLTNLITYFPRETPDDSIDRRSHMKRYLNLFTHASPQLLNAVVYGSAGYCSEQLNQPDDALHFYRMAAQASKKDGNILFQKDHLCNVAEIFMSRGHYDSAFHYMNAYGNLSDEDVSLATQYRYQTIMSRLYTHKQEWRKTIASLQNASHIDSLINKREKSDQLLKHEQEVAKLKAETQLLQKEKSITQQKNKVLVLSTITVLIALAIIVLVWLQQQKRKQMQREKELALQEAREKENHLYNNLVQQEMAALFAKLNPHFIFNALNPLTSFLLQNQNKEALAYLNQVAVLMRGFINLSQIEFAPIKDVLVFLRHYVEVQQHRFNFTFAYQEQVHTGLTEFLIPALMLQPLIENAIEHGVTHSNQRGNGDITIFIEPGDEQPVASFLAICISNKGPLLHKNFKASGNHALGIIQDQLLTIEKRYGTGKLILRNRIDQTGVECIIYLPCITMQMSITSNESSNY